MANKTMVMLLSPLEFFSFRVCVCRLTCVNSFLPWWVPRIKFRFSGLNTKLFYMHVTIPVIPLLTNF